MAPAREPPLLDPRRGDAEDDTSSPKQRSLFAIAGSLLAEISLPKLLFAWVFSIVLPASLLGLAPLVATAWLLKLSKSAAQATGLGATFVLMIVVAAGWFGWRPLFRVAERNFWSLNALAIQPGYAFCREALRYLADHTLSAVRTLQRARASARSARPSPPFSCLSSPLRSPSPSGRRPAGWERRADLLDVRALVLPTLANAVVILCVYLAATALIWGFGDALMDQPITLDAFDAASTGTRWRVAHLSDIHLVGERYGFRIESGRSGPRGNDRFARILNRIEAIHAAQPLDMILITGDMTDAGIATEWAEFLDAVDMHPAIAERMLILPGNHDLNIVDRLNPARLDLPFSPKKRLRQMRTLSALAAIQGHRVRVVDRIRARSIAPSRKQYCRIGAGSANLPIPAASGSPLASASFGTISFPSSCRRPKRTAWG